MGAGSWEGPNRERGSFALLMVRGICPGHGFPVRGDFATALPLVQFRGCEDQPQWLKELAMPCP